MTGTPPIPRTIHQTWKDTNPPAEIFDPAWMASWQRLNPGYDYKLWTDADNRRLIAERFPWFLETFDRYPLNIHRADAARYFILYAFGGVYVDLDFQCLRGIAPLLGSSRLVLGLMGGDASFPDAIPNAFIASAAGHELWPAVFEALTACADRGRVEERTGPVLLGNVLRARYPQLVDNGGDSPDVRLVGSGRIYPINWREASAYDGNIAPEIVADPGRRFPEAYCITYWTRSWNGEEPARGRRRSERLDYRLARLGRLT